MKEQEGSSAAAAATAAAVRGKRTKRRRRHNQAEPSLSTASSESIVTEEEEDMANCLILLARGSCDAGGGPLQREYSAEGKQRIDRGVTNSAAAAAAASAPAPAAAAAAPTAAAPAAAAPTAAAAAPAGGGGGVYECKTCNKRFASFQALGGHRASHKKPKLGGAAEKEGATIGRDGANARESNISSSKSSTGSYKIHECSICGSEFSSGQALGGHMRRHRPPAPETQQSGKKETMVSLSHAFDLNLLPPASFDDVDDTKGVVSSPALDFARAGDQRPPLDVLPAGDCDDPLVEQETDKENQTVHYFCNNIL